MGWVAPFARDPANISDRKSECYFQETLAVEMSHYLNRRITNKQGQKLRPRSLSQMDLGAVASSTG